MRETDDLLVALKQLTKQNKGITLITSSHDEKYISYRELWEKSSFVCSILKSRGACKGTKVVIRCENSEFYIYAFWACVIGNFIAVPLDASSNEYSDKLTKHAFTKLDNPYMLYDTPEQDFNLGKQAVNLLSLNDDIKHVDKIEDIELVSDPDDIVYILFSSGTTGEPRGVIIRKSNIAANVESFIKHYEMKPDDKFLSWSPLTHCYGLVIFHILPIILGANQYLIPTNIYMKTPLLWMDKVNQHRATRTGTLPFALKHFINIYKQSNMSPDWDLSCVKSMFIGGEQVNYPLCTGFTNLVKKLGFSRETLLPLYGLTEATIMVCANRQGKLACAYKVAGNKLVLGEKVDYMVAEESDIENSFLEMGTALDSTTISIMDDNYNTLPDGYLGHVYVSGASVTSGYYKDEEATSKIIYNGKWLYTGDIGFIAEKSLVIVGREKELIVANGKKYACISIENIINNQVENRGYGQSIVCNGLNMNDSAERVIIFVQASLNLNNTDDIHRFITYSGEIKQKLFEVAGLTIDEIIPIESFPKTFSGKLFRRGLTNSFNTGLYSPIIDKLHEQQRNNKNDNKVTEVEDALSRTEIIKEIVKSVEALFQIKITDYNLPFTDYGIISINIPPFVEKLNAVFGTALSISVLFSFTNVNMLTDHIYKLMNKNKKNEVREEMSNENVQNGDRIAIIGTSCRFPAGANSNEQFWDVMMSGKDGIVDIPESRWDLHKYYDEDENAPGKMYCRKGGFLDQPIDEFDAGLFNISPMEASFLDPQQRLLLELTWEAFENAGLDISKYSGSNTGVYLGISSDEYALSGIYSGDLTKVGAYSLTGGCVSAICGRVSYIFGFEGPCLGVDTACSSSLTALHLACNAIKAGEAEMAVVSGVNLILSPVISVAFSKLRAISPDGHSKAFDASANGYARAEGGGVLLLKKLSEAVRDKDNILGVICATGINQDGKSNGLTAPNGAAQAKLMRNTLAASNLTAQDIDYLEMHGTGTKLGDPIEVSAVAEVYCENRSKENPLRIGSVKSNIGHLEPVSGIASIIKVLLALKNKTIPANLHFNTPNPYIDWDNIPIKVVSEPSKWEKQNDIRRAGINGFGFGGSNAHVIIEEYKATEENKEESTEKTENNIGLDYILKITAKNEKSLREYIFKYIKRIEQCEDADFADLIYSADRGRSDFNYRLAITGGSREEISDRLKGFLIGANPSGVFCSHGEKNIYQKDRKFIFMFTGQGSQYVNMGKMLFESSKAFKEAMTLCDRLFKPYILESVINLLYGDKAKSEIIERTVFAQPLIFSIDYALYKMWESYGIVPEIVMGHSIGEYAAAVAAGIVSLEDAVKLVSLRGRLMDIAPGEGAMGTIFANEATVKSLIEKYSVDVSIATINAKESYVISGERAAVDKILADAEEQGIRIKRLKVSHAFHSKMMEPIMEDFKSYASEVSFSAPKLRYASALYAEEIGKNQILDADYWTRHIREKVDFYHTVKNIDATEEYVFLEVGANRILSALCKLIFDEDKFIASTLNMKRNDAQQVSETLALLYAAGAHIQWENLEFKGQKLWKRISVPNYPYDKNKFWLELDYDNRENMTSSMYVHSLLGERIESPFMENTVVFQRKFTANEPYFMSEHIIFNMPISPAAAHVSFVLSAVKELKNPASCTIKSIEFRAPLVVNSDEERLVQVCLQEKEDGRLKFTIVSRDDNSPETQWLTHAVGEVLINTDYTLSQKQTDFTEFETWKLNPIPPEEGTYALMRSSGFYLGDGFRRIMKTAHEINNEGEYVSQIIPLANIPDLEKYILYPGTIDSIFQTGTLLEVTRRQEKDKLVVDSVIEETMIPYFLEEFTYNYKAMSQLQAYTSIRSTDKNFIHADIEAFNEKGELVVRIKDLMARITNRDSLLQGIQNNFNQFYYHPIWVETDESYDLTQGSKPMRYVVVSDESSMAECLSKRLSEYGIESDSVINGDETYLKKNDHVYQINQSNEDSWSRLLNDIIAANEGSQIKIIYCSGMNRVYQIEQGKLSGINTENLKGLLYLIQAVERLGVNDNIRIKVLTKNAQQVSEEQGGNLSQAPLWGFAKVLGLEFPKVFEGIVDVDEQSLREGNLVAELVTKNADEVCLHDGKRYVGRIIKHSKRAKRTERSRKSLTVMEDATYLITGGTGAVGMVFVDRLVNMGAKNLLLLCRRQPSEKVNLRINEFRNKGIQIKIVYADVCDGEGLETALTQAIHELPAIRGVIHAAGAISDKFIVDQTWKNFETVLNPKVSGLVNLYNLLNKDELDFLIMMSSITSLLGNLGQSNYAAANYFLNRFAAEMTRQGIPVYSMCWGPWQSGGMASERAEVERNMNTMGLKAFPNEVGGQIIEQFFSQPFGDLMIADIDWKTMGNNTNENSQRALLADILAEYSVQKKSDDEDTSILDTLKSMEKRDEKKAFLLDILQKVCGKIMGFSRSELLDVNIALREQGADSLMMFSMRSTVNKQLNTDIDVSTFFNYPTLVELTNYLIDQVLYAEIEEVLDEQIDESASDVLSELEKLLD